MKQLNKAAVAAAEEEEKQENEDMRAVQMSVCILRPAVQHLLCRWWKMPAAACLGLMTSAVIYLLQSPWGLPQCMLGEKLAQHCSVWREIIRQIPEIRGCPPVKLLTLGFLFCFVRLTRNLRVRRDVLGCWRRQTEEWRGRTKWESDHNLFISCRTCQSVFSTASSHMDFFTFYYIAFIFCA